MSEDDNDQLRGPSTAERLDILEAKITGLMDAMRPMLDEWDELRKLVTVEERKVEYRAPRAGTYVVQQADGRWANRFFERGQVIATLLCP